MRVCATRFAWRAARYPFPEAAGSLAGATIRYDGDPAREELRTSGFHLPEDLERFAVKRQRDYLAGRIAAREALTRLDVTTSSWPLQRNLNGSPQWPPGVAGSISHSQGIAVAVVATAAHYPVVGVDVQALMGPEQRRRMERQVLPEALPCPPGWTPEAFLTLAFSAKESLFKALSRDVGNIFGFDAAHLTEVDTRRNLFRLRVARRLAENRPAGVIFVGRYALGDNWLMTGVGF